MQPNPQPPRDAGGRPTGLILKVALVLSLLVMAVSIVKFSQWKRADTPGQTVDKPPAPPPRDRVAAPRRPPQVFRANRANASPPGARLLPNSVQAGEWSPSNLWALGRSSSKSGYLIAGRIPELRTGWDGLLACIDQPVFYKIPPQYYDELRGDIGQIAKATNMLQQSEVEFRTLMAGLEKDRQDYLRHARAADEHRQDEAAGAMKRLLELQALYQERKREFEAESTPIKPQLEDAPDVFDKKLRLYERATLRYADDMKQLESALYTVQKELYATNQTLRGLSRNIEAAWEQSAQDAIGRLNVFSNRLHERLGEVNTLVRDYNAKLARYGSPLGTSR